MLKIRAKRVLPITIGILGVLIVSFGAINLLKQSFALPTGVITEGLPSGKFTTNYSTSGVKNYIKDALNSGSTYTSYYNNFDVAENLKTNDSSHPLYSIMKNLAFPKTTEDIELVDGNPSNVTDKGLMYIIAHGYNSTNSTNTVFTSNKYGGVTENNIKEYITQMAIWLYLFEHKSTSTNYCIDTGAGVNACDFYTGTNTVSDFNTIKNIISEAGKNSSYNYLNYIITLVDEADKATTEEASVLTPINFDSEYTISDNNDYILTNAITPGVKSNSANFMYYKLEISDPNKYGAYLVDNQNKKIDLANNFSGAFKVYIPIKDSLSKMDLSSVTVTVYGYFVKLNGYSYRVTKSSVTSEDSIDNLMNNYDGTKYQKYANLLLGYVPYEVVSTSFTLSNIVMVSKVDIANSKELPGASMKITKKNDDGNSWTWTSTDKPHYLYLENGEYQLCETAAPQGYVLNTECVDFTVDGKGVKAVQMTNEKEVEIPDTSSFISVIFYIVGGLLIIGGVGAIILIYTKKSAKE